MNEPLHEQTVTIADEEWTVTFYPDYDTRLDPDIEATDTAVTEAWRRDEWNYVSVVITSNDYRTVRQFGVEHGELPGVGTITFDDIMQSHGYRLIQQARGRDMFTEVRTGEVIAYRQRNAPGAIDYGRVEVTRLEVTGYGVIDNMYLIASIGLGIPQGDVKVVTSLDAALLAYRSMSYLSIAAIRRFKVSRSYHWWDSSFGPNPASN